MTKTVGTFGLLVLLSFCAISAQAETYNFYFNKKTDQKKANADATVPAAIEPQAQLQMLFRVSTNLFFARREVENAKVELKMQSVTGGFLETEFHPIEKFSLNALVGTGFLTSFSSERTSFFAALEGQFIPLKINFSERSFKLLEFGVLMGMNTLQRVEDLPVSAHFGAKAVYFFKQRQAVQAAVRANFGFWSTSLGYVFAF